MGDIPSAIDNFRQLVKEGGRDPDSVTITVQVMDPSEDRLKMLRDLGIERANIGVSIDMWDKPDQVMPMIDRYAKLIPELTA